MAADHSARGSMKTGVKPETVCELQDTNDHRQVERKWRLPISVGKLSALEGRFENLHRISCVQPWTFAIRRVNVHYDVHSVQRRPWRRLKRQFWRRHCSHIGVHALIEMRQNMCERVNDVKHSFRPRGCWTTH